MTVRNAALRATAQDVLLFECALRQSFYVLFHLSRILEMACVLPINGNPSSSCLQIGGDNGITADSLSLGDLWPCGSAAQREAPGEDLNMLTCV